MPPTDGIPSIRPVWSTIASAMQDSAKSPLVSRNWVVTHTNPRNLIKVSTTYCREHGARYEVRVGDDYKGMAPKLIDFGCRYR